MAAKALKWGLAIGLVNLIWLYVAYYLGLHTNGIWVFQIFMLIWLVLTITGFVVALRCLKRDFPRMTYLQGLCAGFLAALAPPLSPS